MPVLWGKNGANCVMQPDAERTRSDVLQGVSPQVDAMTWCVADSSGLERITPSN